MRPSLSKRTETDLPSGVSIATTAPATSFPISLPVMSPVAEWAVAADATSTAAEAKFLTAFPLVEAEVSLAGVQCWAPNVAVTGGNKGFN